MPLRNRFRLKNHVSYKLSIIIDNLCSNKGIRTVSSKKICPTNPSHLWVAAASEKKSLLIHIKCEKAKVLRTVPVAVGSPEPNGNSQEKSGKIWGCFNNKTSALPGILLSSFQVALGCHDMTFWCCPLFSYINRCWCSWKLFTHTFTQNKTLVGEKKVVRHLKLSMSCLAIMQVTFFRTKKNQPPKIETAPCPHPWQSHWPWHSTTQDQ